MTELVDRSVVESFLPLSEPDAYILASLRRGDKHGYAIGSHVQELSEQAVVIQPGNLYTALKRFREAGCIQEVPQAANGKKNRRVYTLTDLGKSVAQAELERREFLLDVLYRK